MYERFVSSIPIFDPRTEQYHDGCTRTVVYSRNGQTPIVLGSQWRLAPKSIDDSTAPLEERFRANLSRGAREMPIAPEHERAINDFAVVVVKEFEQSLDKWNEWVRANPQDEQVLEEMWPSTTLSEKFRASFWATYFLQQVQRANIDISYLENEMIPLPGFHEACDEIFERMSSAAKRKVIK